MQDPTKLGLRVRPLTLNQHQLKMAPDKEVNKDNTVFPTTNTWNCSRRTPWPMVLKTINISNRVHYLHQVWILTEKSLNNLFHLELQCNHLLNHLPPQIVHQGGIQWCLLKNEVNHCLFKRLGHCPLPQIYINHCQYTSNVSSWKDFTNWETRSKTQVLKFIFPRILSTSSGAIESNSSQITGLPPLDEYPCQQPRENESARKWAHSSMYPCK